jgi:hypothetical protein
MPHLNVIAGNYIAKRTHVAQDRLNGLNETQALIIGVERFLVSATEQVDFYATIPTISPAPAKTNAIRANVSDRVAGILVNYGSSCGTAAGEGFKF